MSANLPLIALLGLESKRVLEYSGSQVSIFELISFISSSSSSFSTGIELPSAEGVREREGIVRTVCSPFAAALTTLPPLLFKIEPTVYELSALVGATLLFGCLALWHLFGHRLHQQVASDRTATYHLPFTENCAPPNSRRRQQQQQTPLADDNFGDGGGGGSSSCRRLRREEDSSRISSSSRLKEHDGDEEGKKIHYHQEQQRQQQRDTSTTVGADLPNFSLAHSPAQSSPTAYSANLEYSASRLPPRITINSNSTERFNVYKHIFADPQSQLSLLRTFGEEEDLPPSSSSSLFEEERADAEEEAEEVFEEHPAVFSRTDRTPSRCESVCSSVCSSVHFDQHHPEVSTELNSLFFTFPSPTPEDQDSSNHNNHCQHQFTNEDTSFAPYYQQQQQQQQFPVPSAEAEQLVSFDDTGYYLSHQLPDPFAEERPPAAQDNKSSSSSEDTVENHSPKFGQSFPPPVHHHQESSAELSALAPPPANLPHRLPEQQQPVSYYFPSETDTDSELGELFSASRVVPQSAPSSMMATAPPPPAPPPMPGTVGAMPVPNWRDNYQPPQQYPSANPSYPVPNRESAPSRDQIAKQQYAHLPDKLLNAMNKDKKPFTYTPSGVGEKGVLDLTEIRSPRMKRRLMANLHAGDEEEPFSTDDEGSRPSSSLAMVNHNSSSSPVPPSRNIYQQSFAPCVLPPLESKTRSGGSPVPPPPREKKEVRFAPSPILVLSDDEELTAKLQRRRLDVEARSKICTNQPDTEISGAPSPPPPPPPPQQQSTSASFSQSPTPTPAPVYGAPPPPPIIETYTPQSYPPVKSSAFVPPTPPPQPQSTTFQQQQQQQQQSPPPPTQSSSSTPSTAQNGGAPSSSHHLRNEHEMASLIASASSAVQFGRELATSAAQSAQSPPPYSNQPYTSPASPTVVQQQLQHQQCDANNNSIEQPSEPPLYENGSSQLPSPPILAPYSPGGNSSSSLSTSVFRPTAVLPVQSGQQQTPTPDGGAQSERVSVEQQEECNSSSAANVQQEGEEEEAKMRQMISRIESELSEMRLKEQQQSLLNPQPPSSSGIASGLNHSAGSAPEQERILDGAAAACTRTANQSADCRDSSCTAVGSAFRRVQAPKPPSQPQSNHNQQPSLYSQESPPLAPSQPKEEEEVPLEEMQAYQQRPASSASYNHQQQSAILETLFNDMQDEIAKFEAISRETEHQHQQHSHQHQHVNHQHVPASGSGYPSVQVTRTGPCGVQPPSSRGYNAPSNDGGGRTSCPPFQHEHLMDSADGSIRCVTPSGQTMHHSSTTTTTTSNYNSAFNPSPRPFYRGPDGHPGGMSHDEPLYRAQVVSLPAQQQSQPSPASVGAAGKKKRVIPFAFKNQLPRPADDIAPEIVEERINPVQQQIAERELYAHQARNRAIKTTKNFVNQCVNQGGGAVRGGGTPLSTVSLASSGQVSSLPGHPPGAPDDTEVGASAVQRFSSGLEPGAHFSAVGGGGSSVGGSTFSFSSSSPNSPTSPNAAVSSGGKMYYGSLPRKVKLNSRGQIKEPSPPKPTATAAMPVYTNPEEGRQYLANNKLFSQLPPPQQRGAQPPPPPPNSVLQQRMRPVSAQPSSAGGYSYDSSEEGRGYLGGGLYSQLPPPPPPVMKHSMPPPMPSPASHTWSSSIARQGPGQQGLQQQQQPRSNSSNSYVNHEDGRAFLSGGQMFSQLPPKTTGAQFQSVPPPLLLNNNSTDKEDGRAYFEQNKMFSQMPPGGEEPNTSSSYFESIKARQSSLPPPMIRPGGVGGVAGTTTTNTQLWTPPPTPPLPIPVNSSLGQQQQTQQAASRMTLQQLRRLPPSERPVEPTPSKYTGASIPSRSFRLLQLITGEDIENQYSSNSSAGNAAAAAVPTPSSPSARPASSMAAFGRPAAPRPQQQPVSSVATTAHFTNQPNVSYTAAATDFGTDF